jgi:hypothetical protein
LFRGAAASAGEFDALHMLGLIEYQRGDFPKALRLIAAALRSNGNSADGGRTSAWCFKRREKMTRP